MANCATLGTGSCVCVVDLLTPTVFSVRLYLFWHVVAVPNPVCPRPLPPPQDSDDEDDYKASELEGLKVRRGAGVVQRTRFMV